MRPQILLQGTQMSCKISEPPKLLGTMCSTDFASSGKSNMQRMQVNMNGASTDWSPCVNSGADIDNSAHRRHAHLFLDGSIHLHGHWQGSDRDRIDPGIIPWMYVPMTQVWGG